MRRSRWNVSISRKTLRKPPGGSASSTRSGKSCSFHLALATSHLAQSSSASRATAGASGFFILSRSESGRNGRRKPDFLLALLLGHDASTPIWRDGKSRPVVQKGAARGCETSTPNAPCSVVSPEGLQAHPINHG